LTDWSLEGDKNGHILGFGRLKVKSGSDGTTDGVLGENTIRLHSVNRGNRFFNIHRCPKSTNETALKLACESEKFNEFWVARREKGERLADA